MLKPVSILALDDAAVPLGMAVQQRIAAWCGLDDLVQCRAVSGEHDLAQAIQSIHARRQAPDSPLRARDDVSTREVVFLIVSAAGPARTTALETASQIRRLYEMRRLAEYYTIEILCLMPELFAASTVADYGAAYSLLKQASGVAPRPFDTIWLLDAMNEQRVKFGTLDQALSSYADAVAGALSFEPEMSGAPPSRHPRGMHPTFSSFGYAELFFPRELALRRLEPRLAAELVRAKLIDATSTPHSRLEAKQFVTGDEFAVPLTRLCVDAGQSLFRRFQPKTQVTETSRNADELIAAVRNELRTHREGTHAKNLHLLATQGEQTAQQFAALLSRVTDETLDRDDYRSAIALAEALLDPLPDLRPDTDVAPRNLITEINTATAASDRRLNFFPNTGSSTAARKRVRELDKLLSDQQLVADTLTPVHADEQLAAIERERDGLTRQLPDLIFAEETENDAARNAAIDAESTRLSEATKEREQQLRTLFETRTRVEQALVEALEERRTFLQRQCIWAIAGVIAMSGACFLLSIPYITIPIALMLFAVWSLFHYATRIASHVRACREQLERINTQIETTDKSIAAAHNDELQFEYDVAHRRTTLSVLSRTRRTAQNTLAALRARFTELETLATTAALASIVSSGVSISLVEDADVDAWYERTAADRQVLFREFPVKRSESRHLSLEELQQRIAAHAARGFDALRTMTIAQAATLTTEAALAQRLKRFAQYSAPMIELRDDDLQAREVTQRDTTLWIDHAEPAFVTAITHRIPDAHTKGSRDPLRIHAVSRVQHYPAYLLGQFDYYRAQYDPAAFPESAAVPDLLPPDLALTAPVRAAYEQILLARAVGVIRLRDDGQLATNALVLGDSHLTAAQHLASSDTTARALERELAPRLSIAANVERDLQQLLETVPPLSAFDRSVVSALAARYGLV
jgi:ABC-type multidrug transport system fused ATPase/permease subunit